MSLYFLATLDTKGPEAVLLRSRLIELGVDVTLVDTGSLGTPSVQADVSREEVFAAAGNSLQSIVARRDRGAAVGVAADGAAAIVAEAWAAGRLTGVISIGGSAGTTIGTTAMRALPIGVPKLMVSTMASGPVRAYVGDKDILMFNSVVDLAGINRISETILKSAAAAMAGMVMHHCAVTSSGRPLVAASMFGVTTPCVQNARKVLEQAGYEVLIFHATGNGGQAMESLIRDGMIAGVLDITTTELADELVGGVLSAGPDRLTAAARHKIPQVVSVGATDMVNFGGEPPECFSDRQFYVHNPTVTLMRTTRGECQAIGKDIAEKLLPAVESSVVLFPLGGVSAIDAPDQPFEDQAARHELLAAIRQHGGDLEIVELDCHINDVEFAEAAARRLIEMMERELGSRHDGDLSAD